ncbi:hypothetical protein L873DRAFT_473953 [Choiromyces venosus 120613-1]|uniref:Secreted protein n=1 Tax=Choiromyces venosus 120613-1 TaxID=1336337 RepID=A0A3N4IVI4_9PEZI|nr:hypothetical protein L873DRAFT_473953 [Choiromyces venosus 120613-1]
MSWHSALLFTLFASLSTFKFALPSLPTLSLPSASPPLSTVQAIIIAVSAMIGSHLTVNRTANTSQRGPTRLLGRPCTAS